MQKIVVESSQNQVSPQTAQVRETPCHTKVSARRRMSHVINQPEPRIRRASKLRIVIVANARAQNELRNDTEFILRTAPDDRALRHGDRRVVEIQRVLLILFEVVDDLGPANVITLCFSKTVRLNCAHCPTIRRETNRYRESSRGSRNPGRNAMARAASRDRTTCAAPDPTCCRKSARS